MPQPYIRTDEIKEKTKVHLPKDILYQEYILNKISLKDIASKYGWSKSNVRKKIIDYGIGIRTQKEACNMPIHIAKVASRKPHLGIKHDVKDRENIRNGIIMSKLDKDKWKLSKDNFIKSLHEYYNKPGVRDIISNRQKMIWCNYDDATKESIVNKRKMWWNEERRIERSLYVLEYYKIHPEYKSKLVSRLRENWQRKTKEERELWIQKAMLCACKRPNKPEAIILNILNELYPKQWGYTGNGSFIIGGLNPDFVNINGQKKVIEMFGDYWHRNDDSDDRIKIFSGYGYLCLIIWEHELENIKEVTDKIISFQEM